MNDEQQCARCRFWEEIRDTLKADDGRKYRGGECRRLPPVVLMGQMPTLEVKSGWSGVWPETESDDWCGEFKPRA